MLSGRFLILRSKVFKESDLIIDALSKEGERFTLTAKNAVRSKRRFAGGVLEPLQYVEFYFTQAKSSYFYIQEAKVINAFASIRTDYARLELGFYFLKIINKGTQEGHMDNKALFDLLGNTLESLQSSKALEVLRIQFELKYLYFQGLLLEDEDTTEFIQRPIGYHQKIELTEDEIYYMKKITKNLMLQNQSFTGASL